MVVSNVNILNGYQVRAASLDDTAAVTSVYRADELAFAGRAEMTEDLVRADWSSPDRDLARDAWVVEDPTGQIIAVADLNTTDGIRVWGGAVVHPDYLERCLGSALLVRVEARARELAEKAPDGVRSTLAVHIAAKNDAGHALVERRGYALTRRFWEMGIDLTERAREEPPALPAGMRIRTFVPGQDDRAVFDAQEEAFADHWGHTPGNYDEWRYWLLEHTWSDPSLLFLAVDGDEIAGIALCSFLFGRENGHVHTLGVRRAWRKRGVGRALLLHAFDILGERGAKLVTLGVDSQSLTGATRLYESVGMRVLSGADRFELELRPGRDITTQTLADEPPGA